ncbi:MAG: short-chain dehydrogenase [Arenimonas sp. SCN 70-307]|uniref:SDR family NAD(P)-dependent oxidoreductase n=1 Tax=Arenimonas sp. SCN 70-307 TaxID=1660089 RepID=UPI00086C9D34|nr:SDR family oxidoreductase [Arenimonas sp. SCN 70-307]ODS62360.1 MAG: short-chain dehydrogenase [Arenimonas sp. SCN 70-307]
MQTALITGASGGVATALAERLRARSWRLALVTRDASRVQAQAGDLVIEADVGTEQGAESAIAQACEAFGAPPAAVAHCAGAVLVAPLARTSEAQYRQCLSANLDSAFFVSKAYAPRVQKAGQGGSLLLFSSVAAGIGVANHAAIAIAKGGVEGLVRALAADFSASGLRVNAIAPGLMHTPATARMLSSEASAKAIRAQYPLGRHGEAEDAAALGSFLLSEEAGWVTGQVIALDGGFQAVRPLVRGA